MDFSIFVTEITFQSKAFGEHLWSSSTLCDSAIPTGSPWSVKTIGGLGRGKKKVNAGHCATDGDQSIASGWHGLEPLSPPACPLIQFPLRFLRTAVFASENSKVTATLRKTSIQKWIWTSSFRRRAGCVYRLLPRRHRPQFKHNICLQCWVPNAGSLNTFPSGMSLFNPGKF